MTLVIALVVILLIWYVLTDNKGDSSYSQDEEAKINVRFFGGPLDKLDTDIPVIAVTPEIYIPMRPDEDGEYIEVGGVRMVEPIFARYEAVGGDSDYFYREDVDRATAMMALQKMHAEKQNGPR